MVNVILAAVDFYGEWYGWLPLCLLAVITAIIIQTIFLMLGRAFSIRELEAFAKSEMMQAAATAFMAIFLVLMVESAFLVSQQFIGGAVMCGSEPINIGKEEAQTTMDDAYDAIRCRLQERAVEVARIQDRITSGADIWWDYTVLNSAISIFGITFFKGDWVSSLYKKTETTRISNNLATVLLIGLNAQSALLDYLKINMLHVFIPVGILLRSFYFTRGPGALFIAMGVGMYFIFPIMFILLDPGFIPSAPSPAPVVPQQQAYCYPTMSNVITVMTSLEEGGLGSSSGLAFSSIRSDLAKSYIALMLHPLVALFLTMVFVRYMMSILGGDTYEVVKMLGKVV